MSKETLPTGPLKILLFTIQQTIYRQIHLDIDIEAQQIRSILLPFINTGWVNFYAPVDGCFNTLERLLQNDDWHLVIISGHGLLKNNQTYLVSETGKLITGNELAKIFKHTKVRCIVLATCKSGQLVKHNLIEPLVKLGIPNIIGMQDSLIDRAGRIFTQELCLNLAKQKTVDIAVQASCNAMKNLLTANEIWQQPNDSISKQHGLPILFSHDSILINWNFKPHKINVIPETKIFIGRQQELKYLIKKLQIGTIQRMCIVGTSGIGKTALAEQLAISLLQDGYQILNSETKNLQTNQRIILTSRVKISTLSYYYTYQLERPNFYDFARYISYLGLPYEFPQILRIYQALAGNFRAAQLLLNLPVCLDITGLNKQLLIVQRYLQAELRK